MRLADGLSIALQVAHEEAGAHHILYGGPHLQGAAGMVRRSSLRPATTSVWAVCVRQCLRAARSTAGFAHLLQRTLDDGEGQARLHRGGRSGRAGSQPIRHRLYGQVTSEAEAASAVLDPPACMHRAGTSRARSPGPQQRCLWEKEGWRVAGKCSSSLGCRLLIAYRRASHAGLGGPPADHPSHPVGAPDT